MDSPTNGKDTRQIVVPNGSCQNIVLIGVMGSGKTAIGERLAHALKLGFMDVDQQIEMRHKKSIAELFKAHDEVGFRSIELEMISYLKNIRNHVIATGGGVVTNDETWQVLKTLGVVVWIRTPAQEIARRLVMKPDELRSRPLLTDLVEIEERDKRQLALSQRIETLLLQRQKRYAEAHLTVDVSYSTPEIAAQLLKQILDQEGLFRH